VVVNVFSTAAGPGTAPREHHVPNSFHDLIDYSRSVAHFLCEAITKPSRHPPREAQVAQLQLLDDVINRCLVTPVPRVDPLEVEYRVRTVQDALRRSLQTPGTFPNLVELLPPIHFLALQVDAASEAPTNSVDLDTIAALAHLKKDSLKPYKRRRRDPLPDPDYSGGAGHRDYWKWTTIHPWLCRNFPFNFPENGPPRL
jgi:hypothetical protein